MLIKDGHALPLSLLHRETGCKQTLLLLLVIPWSSWNLEWCGLGRYWLLEGLMLRGVRLGHSHWHLSSLMTSWLKILNLLSNRLVKLTLRLELILLCHLSTAHSRIAHLIWLALLPRRQHILISRCLIKLLLHLCSLSVPTGRLGTPVAHQIKLPLGISRSELAIELATWSLVCRLHQIRTLLPLVVLGVHFYKN